MLAVFNALEPLLLVAVGAIATGVGTGLNDRRKRKHDLEDKIRAEQREDSDNRREVLGQIIELQDRYYNATMRGGSGRTKAESRKEYQALRAKAITFGDQEILALVEEGPGSVMSDGKALRRLVTRKIQELNEEASD